MKVKENNFTDNEISKALKIYNYFIENSFSNFEIVVTFIKDYVIKK